MQTWLNRTLGILALGGSAIGFTIILTAIISEQPVSSKVSLALFLPVYSWGVWCGVKMLERHPGAIRTNLIFWAIQVPVLQSTAFTYLLSSGVLGGVWLQLSPAKITALGWLGSRFELAINQPKPFAFGLNLVAVAICVVLLRARRGQPSDDPLTVSPDATPKPGC